MQLSKVVGAILNDLSVAQALANDYSSQLSYKYKRGGFGKDGNSLSNFRVPSTVLSEISLELKFIIQEINSDAPSLDVEKTQRHCDDLAARCIPFLYSDFLKLAGGGNAAREVLPLKFLENLETIVSQDLFSLCERFFVSEKDLTISEVNNTIANTLETELLQNKGIQNIPELRVEINSASDDPLSELSRVQQARKQFRSYCLSWAETTTRDIDVSTIIQTTIGSPNTNISINPEDLKNIPTETIQCLQISARYANQRWAISESKLK